MAAHQGWDEAPRSLVFCRNGLLDWDFGSCREVLGWREA